MNAMTILIVLALIGTLITLGWGVGSMAHGGRYDEEHSFQLMAARVGFQAVTLVLLAIAAVISLG